MQAAGFRIFLFVQLSPEIIRKSLANWFYNDAKEGIFKHFLSQLI